MNRTLKLIIVYLFSWLGSLIVLAVEKEDAVVREHAAQGLGWGIVSFALSAVLSWVPVIGLILSLLTLVITILLIVKACMGGIFKIPLVYDLSQKAFKNLFK
ncbi:MAG: DUF4870 domain-containing protein [Clostridiales bacterium]|nr:DUF4870 domain-containing protein [Clostridiales bacterium]